MISKRLNVIASLVDSNKIIDIGCDHALLDIYLTNKGFDCVAIDNKETVLDKARCNIKKNNLFDKIKIICSNGLENYSVLGNENVIIAGMGTNTILNILQNKEFNKINTLIIQSNNNLYELRKKVCKLGFYIDKEMALFDKKYYNIIRFKRGFKKYSYFDYYFGLDMNYEYKKYVYDKIYKAYKNIPIKNIVKKIKYKILLIYIKQKNC